MRILKTHDDPTIHPGDVVLLDAYRGELVVPRDVVDLESFRTWRHANVLPDKLRVHYLDGKVVMDLTREEF